MVLIGLLHGESSLGKEGRGLYWEKLNVSSLASTYSHSLSTTQLLPRYLSINEGNT